MNNMKQVFGIDYGAKMAGTTAVAYYSQGNVRLFKSDKKKCADTFLLETLEKYAQKGDVVSLDAPLSLPDVYTNRNIEKSSANYHYRKADREVGAMSPMFLGGLTARAMELSAGLITSGLDVYEVYPKMVAITESIDELYAKRKTDAGAIHEMTLMLESKFNFTLEQTPINLHVFDAVLAMVAGLKIKSGEASSWGDAHEGLIYA